MTLATVFNLMFGLAAGTGILMFLAGPKARKFRLGHLIAGGAALVLFIIKFFV